MSLRDLMTSDLAAIHADSTQFGAGEACTYSPVSGTAVSTRMVISRGGTARPQLTESGLFETPAATGFLLVADVATTDLRDTITDAAGVVWNIESIGLENAAVRELMLRRSERAAMLAPANQERR